MKVMLYGPNLPDQSKGTFHVHAKGCAAASARRYPGVSAYELDVDDRYTVSEFMYEDHLGDHGIEPGSSEAVDYLLSELGDFHFHGCCKDLSELVPRFDDDLPVIDSFSVKADGTLTVEAGGTEYIISDSVLPSLMLALAAKVTGMVAA